MKTEPQYTLLRQIMWDYSIPPEELFEVLHGRKKFAGHYTRETIMVKLLESYPWFTILELLSPEELRNLITDNVVNKLRFKSLKTKYGFIQKRLYQTVPAAD
jgi:hypothetical protein